MTTTHEETVEAASLYRASAHHEAVNAAYVVAMNMKAEGDYDYNIIPRAIRAYLAAMEERGWKLMPMPDAHEEVDVTDQADDAPDEPTEALKALMRRTPIWER